jgi:signal transduction histidine kinase/DNA-binding response OmpR family regulator
MGSDFQATVLLVDDRPENLLAMETTLADLGQNLVRANSAREALRFLLVNDVALILLDVQMPGVNGFELAELIRERERTQDTPIIFVSATSREERYIFKGYSLGAVDYLTKPFEPEILKSKVRFFSRLFLQHQEIKRQSVLLERTNTELDSLNCDLETRVQLRTHQLETANAELEKEITVRKESEARLATEHAVTRALADGKDLENAAPKILRAFCEHMEADIVCLWLLQDETADILTCSHIEKSCNGETSDLFVEASRQNTFTRGKGLPGKVWEKNEPVWISNTVLSDKFPRARIAAAAGLNSGVGFPINVDRQFHGAIEFFTRRPLSPDQPFLNMLEAIGSEIGQFVQRKRVEAERESLLLREKSLREQAERANRLKDEFLATVSHELRTPLNAILGWGKILMGKEIDEAVLASAGEAIHRNAKSQAQLIEDLLDTSRLITGNLRLNLAPTPVVDVIESAIEVVRSAADSKRITLSTAYNSDVESIICDPQRLQQIVWNLLTNAIKFTPSEGQVSINLDREDSMIRLVVADTGTGIAPEFLPFVFDRFRQEDSSSTRMHDGLGLGLAIVRNLTELHGGSVSVESGGPAKGSAFTVILPAALVSGVPAEISDASTNGHNNDALGPDLHGVRVLVVDDDDDTCEMLTFALSLLGAETYCSGSVSDAFIALAEHSPDILLTDINMPDEDGYSFIGKLRSLPPENGANIPVIAITAMARPEDSEKVLSAGFQVHLPKPVDIEELSATILKLLKKAKRSGET